MSILNIILVLILAYLLGSIPAAVWIGKAFHNIDVREHGSGNAGTTNTIRVLGWKTGTPVLLIDVAKGWLASMLPLYLKVAETDSPLLINIQIICGIIAIVGHIFPIFAGFRGGKGVATVFGVLLAIQFPLTLSCFAVFMAVMLITGIVSVSSMSAGIAFPILLFTVFETPSVFFRIFSVVVAIALIVTHKKNISRLLRGEEKKLIRWGRKEKSTEQ